MKTLKIVTLAILAAATFGAEAQTTKIAPRSSTNAAIRILERPIVLAAFNQVMITNPNRVSVSVTYQVTILNSDATTTIQTKTASVGPLCTYSDSYEGQNLLFASLSDFQAE